MAVSVQRWTRTQTLTRGLAWVKVKVTKQSVESRDRVGRGVHCSNRFGVHLNDGTRILYYRTPEYTYAASIGPRNNIPSGKTPQSKHTLP
jgi:hypothetical protein